MQNLNLSPEERKEEKAREALREELFNKEVGFSLIVEMMQAKFKKDPSCCLIGHNMMYDVLYVYNQFVGPLPDTYQQFVSQWHAIFPRTYDTKVLSF
jgi:hypothetical protein